MMTHGDACRYVLDPRVADVAALHHPPSPPDAGDGGGGVASAGDGGTAAAARAADTSPRSSHVACVV